MAVPSNAQLDTDAGQPSEDAGWSRRWPVWIPYAAAVWGLLFAAVQVAWAATGTAVPWSPDVAYARAVLWFLAALAVVAAGACLATGRRLARRGGVAVAASLILTVPVFVMGMAGLPAHFVTLASFSGVESATGLAHTLLSAVGAAHSGCPFLRRPDPARLRPCRHSSSSEAVGTGPQLLRSAGSRAGGRVRSADR